MPQELVLLRGPAASGKSTYALGLVSQGYARVNKDSLRTMLHNDVWSKSREKLTKLAHDSIVRDLVLAGYDVVIDNTHLLPNDRKLWEDWVRDMNVLPDLKVRFRVEDFFDTPIEECFARDSKRTGTARVGDEVIRRQFKLMRELQENEKVNA